MRPATSLLLVRASKSSNALRMRFDHHAVAQMLRQSVEMGDEETDIVLLDMTGISLGRTSSRSASRWRLVLTVFQEYHAQSPEKEDKLHACHPAT